MDTSVFFMCNSCSRRHNSRMSSDKIHPKNGQVMGFSQSKSGQQCCNGEWLLCISGLPGIVGYGLSCGLMFIEGEATSK